MVFWLNGGFPGLMELGLGTKTYLVVLSWWIHWRLYTYIDGIWFGTWDAPIANYVCWISMISPWSGQVKILLQEFQRVSCLDYDALWTSCWSPCNWPIVPLFPSFNHLYLPMFLDVPSLQFTSLVISMLWTMNISKSIHQNWPCFHSAQTWSSDLALSSRVPGGCSPCCSLQPAGKLVRFSAAAWFPRQIGRRQRPGRKAQFEPHKFGSFGRKYANFNDALSQKNMKTWF